MPLISVIMNCHNGGMFLKKSIISLLRQSYKNWELIFYDNKSNDNSLNIMRNFKDKRIKLFKSNRYLKLYHARNNAIKLCKGDFISFLDTDDLWHKDKLKIQLEFLKKKKIKFCFSNFYLFFEKNKKNYLKKIIYYSEFPSTQQLLKKYNIGILTVMISKDILKKKFFNSKYEIIGDFDYFINLSFNEKLGFINRPLATYRVHENNTSLKKIDLHFKELNLWIKRREKKFLRKKISLSSQKYYLFKLRLKKLLKSINLQGM